MDTIDLNEHGLGRYLTRDGRLAEVTMFEPGDDHEWCGTVNGIPCDWRDDGRHGGNADLDLVAKA